MSIWEDKENFNNSDAMSISPMKNSPVPKLNLTQFGAKDRTPSPTSRKRKEPFSPSRYVAEIFVQRLMWPNLKLFVYCSPMNISPDRPQKRQRTGNEAGLFKIPSGPLNFNSPKVRSGLQFLVFNSAKYSLVCYKYRRTNYHRARKRESSRVYWCRSPPNSARS
jgi:hypothetical protein